MTGKYMRSALTALGIAAGFTLAACADEQPYPVYNHGVAYYPAPSGTGYYVPSSGTTYYSPSTGTTYYTPSGVTSYSAPCINCDSAGAGWYRYHDGQWHVD
jgi:hypothetical protein